MPNFFRLALVVLASFTGIFVAVLPVAAHATSSRTVNSVSIELSHKAQGCIHVLVHLNGKSQPGKTCLDHPKQSAVPFTYVTNCGSSALFLSSDFYGNGYTICFIGSGFANMTDYNGPWYSYPWNWNDNASYYRIGCSSGAFFTDTNGQGTRQSFGAFESAHNFDGGTSRSGQRILPNDTLSSLTLYSSCN